MFLYLDEAGDLGFNFENKKTSRYFVITVLATNSHRIMNAAVKRTLKNKLRQQKKTRYINELKGNATTLPIKKYFLRQLIQHNDWELYTIVLDKQSIRHQKELIKNIHKLYNLLSKNILNEIPLLYNDPVIQLAVDRSKEQSEVEIFDCDVRFCMEQNMPRKVMLNIEHLASEKNAGLQAVDMFCYGIARRYEQDTDQWYKLFKDRIKQEIIFRP